MSGATTFGQALRLPNTFDTLLKITAASNRREYATVLWPAATDALKAVMGQLEDPLDADGS